MAARKPVITPAPERPELDRLLKLAQTQIVTDEQLKEQRISFAYGNAPIDSNVTKESARTANNSVRMLPA